MKIKPKDVTIKMAFISCQTDTWNISGPGNKVSISNTSLCKSRSILVPSPRFFCKYQFNCWNCTAKKHAVKLFSWSLHKHASKLNINGKSIITSIAFKTKEFLYIFLESICISIEWFHLSPAEFKSFQSAVAVVCI